MIHQQTINRAVAIATALAALFGCTLIYDAVGFVVDAKELFIGAVFLVPGLAAAVRFKGNRRLLLAPAAALVLFLGFVAYRHHSFSRPGLGILCQGGMVFPADAGPFARNALCFSPVRTPHWYESGVEVDFFADNGRTPDALAKQRLIASGAARPVKQRGGGEDMYRATIPRKLFLQRD